MYPDELKYCKTHEWAKIQDDIAIIGITEFAQKELGDVTYVELPEVDSEFNAEDIFGSIDSVKAAEDLYTPLSGKVIEVNSDLDVNPEKVNNSPYEEGWMIKLQIKDKNEIENLLSKDDYLKLIGG